MVIHGEVEGEDRLRWSLENRAIVVRLVCDVVGGSGGVARAMATELSEAPRGIPMGGMDVIK